MANCLVCSKKIPDVPGQEICNSCSAAIPYVRPAHKTGTCPVCTIATDLFHTDYLALDWAACYRDSIIATTRFLP